MELYQVRDKLVNFILIATINSISKYPVLQSLYQFEKKTQLVKRIVNIS